MAVFKKHLTPLTKGGSIQKHAGKGSASAPMPDREQINQLARPPGGSMNDYAKATPLAAAPRPPGGFPEPV